MGELSPVPPPRALISRNPLQWFRFFGPGAIVASVTIGSGELIFPSRGGSIFGYQLLWIFLVVGFFKWALAYCSMRHMVLSGAHPLERWISIPGPRGWLHLFLIFNFVITIPLTYAFLGGILGTACAWIFGVGDHYVWTSVCIGLVVLLLLMGGYNFLEKAQTAILVVMLGCILIAVLYLRPDWLSIARGFAPQPLVYPDWLFSTLPEMSRRSVWVEVLVYVAVIGGSATDYLAYTAFLRDKKWGWSHMGLASQEQLSEVAESRSHPVRLWLRAPLVDTAVSMVMVVVIASAFSILGTVVLRPQQLVPEGINLLNHQASFLTALSPWLLPFYQIAVFIAFFGSLYGGPEIAYRNFYEILRTMPRCRDRLSKRKLRMAVVGWCLGGGLITLWLSRFYPAIELIDIYTPVAIFTGFLMASLYTIANPWMDWRFLPRALRMPVSLVTINLVAAVVFMIAGLKALWDYGQLPAYLGLSASLLVSAFLAFRLRSLFIPRPPSSSASLFQ